jgi:hypothetical protein
MLIFREGHLRHIIKCYMEYYNAMRTHLSLGKDAPIWRDIQCAGASKCGLCLVDCAISTCGSDLR